jgi:phospholipase C
MLENHSFDNMLAMSGISGIYAATTGNCNSYNGTQYCVRDGAPASMPTDPGHEFPDVLEQLAGPGATYPSGGAYPPINNSGFAANYATSVTEGPAPPPADIGDIMACFHTATQLPVLYQLATTFTVCDQWFSSLPGPTWPNRYFLHGASSSGLDHSPTSEEMLEWEAGARFGDGFSYPRGSIFDALTRAGVPYAIYNDRSGAAAGAIPQVASINGITALAIGDVSNLASDLQGAYPYHYTFIEPNYGDITDGSYEGGSSQHPMDGVSGGETLIKTVYEAIRNSQLWESSLLIITYDEHGGFYDHFAPGDAPPPNDGSPSTYNQFGFTFAQFGVRVPAVIVSPWVSAGVDHTIYDHASVAATLEALFGLSPLTDRDKYANNVLHLVNSTARADCPVQLDAPATAAGPRLARTPEEQAALDCQPLPRKGNLPGFLDIMMKTEIELSYGSEEERAVIVGRFRRIATRGDARTYIESVLRRLPQR